MRPRACCPGNRAPGLLPCVRGLGSRRRDSASGRWDRRTCLVCAPLFSPEIRVGGGRCAALRSPTRGRVVVRADLPSSPWDSSPPARLHFRAQLPASKQTPCPSPVSPEPCPGVLPGLRSHSLSPEQCPPRGFPLLASSRAALVRVDVWGDWRCSFTPYFLIFFSSKSIHNSAIIMENK